MEKKSCLKRKKTLESDAVNRGNEFCHPAHDNERQQLQQEKYGNIPHSSRQVYTNTYAYAVKQRTTV